MVAGIFDSVKALLKSGEATIDTIIFRLHCKVTVVILFAFSIIITSGSYIGDPIDCIVDKPVDSVIDTYCWIHSTYTLPHKMNKSALIAHPGVGSHHETDEPKYHKYYQWVCFVLFLQGLMFYFPKYLWKMKEGGRLKMIVKEAGTKEYTMSDEEREEKKEKVIMYLKKNINNHNSYAFFFFFCEILCFVNTVVNIHLTDMFVGYTFSKYGTKALDLINESPINRTDYMDVAFPKVSKCTLRVFGPTGNIISYDALCVLPQNIANEKIYFFLWFWFVFVAVVTGLAVVIRLLSFFPSFRLLSLKMYARSSDLKYPEDLQLLPIGDWFLIYQLGKNMEPIAYTGLLNDLKKIDGYFTENDL